MLTTLAGNSAVKLSSTENKTEVEAKCLFTSVAGSLDESSKVPSYIILAGLKLLAQVTCSCKFTLATGVDRALGRVCFVQV